MVASSSYGDTAHTHRQLAYHMLDYYAGGQGSGGTLSFTMIDLTSIEHAEEWSRLFSDIDMGVACCCQSAEIEMI